MNEKLKQAYERLNLPEDITREELNRQFELLLKRNRSKTSESAAAAYDEEFRAFKYILDARDQQEIEQAEEKRLAKWGKLSGFARKSENFFRLYKTHVIISVIVLIALIVGGNAYYKHLEEKRYLASLPPVDVEIMFLGNYQVQDPSGENDELNDAIVKLYPEWKRVKTNIVFLPTAGGDSGISDMNYMQRAIAEISVNRPDMIIMDQAAFDWIGNQAGFQDLEQLTASGKISSDDPRLIRVQEEDKQLLGAVDISDSQFASNLPLHHLAMIAGVFANDEKKDKSLAFLEEVLSDSSPQTTE